LQCVAVCCSVLQCVVACCSVLQCVAVCCGVLQCAAVWKKEIRLHQVPAEFWQNIIYAYLYIQVYIYICMYIYMYTYICICMYVHVHMYMYMYIHLVRASWVAATVTRQCNKVQHAATHCSNTLCALLSHPSRPSCVVGCGLGVFSHIHTQVIPCLQTQSFPPKRDP